MHITGQVWLVHDRDWSKKVVNATMADCFGLVPEDKEANDEENPGATEVVLMRMLSFQSRRTQEPQKLF
jgi:hypothetical protein